MLLEQLRSEAVYAPTDGLRERHNAAATMAILCGETASSAAATSQVPRTAPRAVSDSRSTVCVRSPGRDGGRCLLPYGSRHWTTTPSHFRATAIISSYCRNHRTHRAVPLFPNFPSPPTPFACTFVGPPFRLYPAAELLRGGTHPPPPPLHTTFIHISLFPFSL